MSNSYYTHLNNIQDSLKTHLIEIKIGSLIAEEIKKIAPEPKPYLVQKLQNIIQEIAEEYGVILQDINLVESASLTSYAYAIYR